jgi:hypothetical protein
MYNLGRTAGSGRGDKDDVNDVVKRNHYFGAGAWDVEKANVGYSTLHLNCNEHPLHGGNRRRRPIKRHGRNIYIKEDIPLKTI